MNSRPASSLSIEKVLHVKGLFGQGRHFHAGVEATDPARNQTTPGPATMVAGERLEALPEPGLFRVRQCDRFGSGRIRAGRQRGARRQR
jgi:hypothetical protein